MNKYILCIVFFFLLVVFVPKAHAQVSITPVFNGIGTCPGNVGCPSTAPSTPPAVTGGQTNPGTTSTVPSEAEMSIVPSQSAQQPCTTGEASVAAKHGKHHKHHSGGVSNFMEMLMKFLMDFINMLLKLIGSGPISLPSPEPNTTPTVEPTSGGVEPSSGAELPDPGCAPTTAPDTVTVPPVGVTGTAPTLTTSLPAPTTPTGGGGNTTCTNPIGSTSDATGTISIPGTSIVVRNEAWNGSHGPQTIYACSEQSWYVMSNQPNQGGAVQTYPDSLYSVSGSKTIPQYTSVTSTFGESYQPVNDWNAGYDIWMNNWSKEIMIWNEWNGGPGYWPSQAKTAVSLGGVPYHFYANGGELMFFRDTQVKSGSVDILAALKWLVTQNLLSSSDVLTQIEYGVEISGTGGTTQRFDTTAFTVSIQ